MTSRYEPLLLRSVADAWRERRSRPGVSPAEQIVIDQVLRDLATIEENEQARAAEIRELCDAPIKLSRCGMMVCRMTGYSVRRKLTAIRKRTL